MSGELSETMRHLRDSWATLHKMIAARTVEHDTANELEAKHKAALEEASARAFLLAEGPVKEREAKAVLETLNERTAYYNAMALRRSSRAALSVLTKELDCITAQGHAYNRELKVLDG